MDIAAICEVLHRQPFEPFLMRLADGRTVSVPHPDFVALGARRVVVVHEDDSWSLIEPLLVVSLDAQRPATRGGNGASTTD